MRALKRTYILGLLALAGCSVTGGDPMDEVGRAVEERTGVRPAAVADPADRGVRECVARLLADKLTLEEAVRIALLNNAEIQAAYERLGVSRAELIQAGLLPNPIFEGEIHFEGSGIGTGTNLTLTEEIVAIFQIPLRRRAAAASYEAAKSELVGEVLALIAEAKTAFLEAQAAEQAVELRRTVHDSASASAEVSARMQRAGNLTPLQVATERLAYARARRELTRAEAEAFEAREVLNKTLGLYGVQTRWEIDNRLPEPPDFEVGGDGLESLAVRRRPELERARHELEAAAGAVGIADAFRLLPELELGVDIEGEDESRIVPGPNFRVPLPLFDHGQARRLEASSRFREAKKKYHALAVTIRSEVRSAYAKLRLAREEASFDRTSLIPAAADLVRHSQLEYNAMLIGVFDLLRARQEQVEAGGSYIEALRDYWVARVELERAIGGELPPGENTADTERGPDERANGAARPQEGTHEPMQGHEHGHHGHGHEE